MHPCSVKQVLKVTNLIKLSLITMNNQLVTFLFEENRAIVKYNHYFNLRRKIIPCLCTMPLLCCYIFHELTRLTDNLVET